MKNAQWIAEHSAGTTFFTPERFYDALPAQEANIGVAQEDLELLEARSLIDLSVSIGGIEGMRIRAKQGIRDQAAWVLSMVAKGASAAVVPVVTAGTDDLLREAARLAAHL